MRTGWSRSRRGGSALLRLEADGFVQILPKRGRVRAADLRGRPRCKRGALEDWPVRRVTRRANDLADELGRLIGEPVGSLTDPVRFIEWDRAFRRSFPPRAIRY